MLPERPDLAEVAEDLTDVTTWVLAHNAFLKRSTARASRTASVSVRL